MEFVVQKTPIEGVLAITPEVFEDERGFFTEVFRQDKFVSKYRSAPKLI